MNRNLFKPFIATAVLILHSCGARAQLAITEVMASASTNLGPARVSQGADYWELTNFGATAVDLNRYKFNDSDGGILAADPSPFANLVIAPGESIIFAQTTGALFTTAEHFKAWWGTRMPAGTRVIYFSGNGLSSATDGVRLWSGAATTDAEVIDQVDFGESVRGSAFVYDPATGRFGVISTNGLTGTFKAEQADDLGSPGTTTGPVLLRISRQPEHVIANPGDTASFSVGAEGLPRPKYQWQFKGAPISGAVFATLNVADVQAARTGDYTVVLNNGLQSITSTVAQLTLRSDSQAPQFIETLTNRTVFVDQPSLFKATASGAPQPVYQWYFNGNPIPDATLAEYLVANAQFSDSGAYTVVARNGAGSVTNTTELTVTDRPALIITEVMSSASTNSTVPGHGDWWELTNLGTNSVDLFGYRFDDSSETLTSAFTFTNHMLISPGESIIFAEGMTPEAFKSWWGARLPSDLKILTYTGNGLSSGGDALTLWNPGAVENSDKLASVVFSTATPGLSFVYDPANSQFGRPAALDTLGAFQAAESDDVASPGTIGIRTRAEAPRFTATTLSAAGVEVIWTTESGKSYTLESRNNVAAGPWNPVANLTATGASLRWTGPASEAAGFFRVIAKP